MSRLLDYLPRGNMLDDVSWHKRHRLLQWVLGVQIPAFLVFGILTGHSVLTSVYVVLPQAACLALGHVITRRRPASIFITAGLTYSSAALVGLSHGSIEAHFYFFIIIGFIALYQDWVPFLWNVLFTILSHGLGSFWKSDLFFNYSAAQQDPWLWSGIHGIAVLAACVGMVIFWRVSEEEQQQRELLSNKLAEAEIGRRKFTSELLVNLARRNQSMLYRQLDIINQLEEKERDPDALAELFRLDHLATRVRRNAESLLVLSGEKPARVWSAPVPLTDVVRAAIAETEHLDRVVFSVDQRLAVAGHTVTDLTHLLAELAENAVRFSPPEANVNIRTRPYLQSPGAYLLTVEDCGVGMPPNDLASTNMLLARPPEVDLSVSQRLGFHVVARLAQRHNIGVSLTPTPGCGVTAVILLPAELFATGQPDPMGQVVGLATNGAPAAGVATARPMPDPMGEVRPQRSFDHTPLPSPRTRPMHAGPVPRAGNGGMNGNGATGGGPNGGRADVRRSDTIAPNGARLNGEVPWLDGGGAAMSANSVGGTAIAPEAWVPPQASSPMLETSAAWPRDAAAWEGWWDAAVAENAATGGLAAQEAHDGAAPQDSPSAVQPAGDPQVRRDGVIPSASMRSGSTSSSGSTATSNGSAAATGSATTNGSNGSDRVGAVPTGPVASAASTATPQSGGLRLNRRVPQSHLAPELRNSSVAAPEVAAAPQQATRDALSRYQASRLAAQAFVEQGGSGDGVAPQRNGGNGGSGDRPRPAPEGGQRS